MKKFFMLLLLACSGCTYSTVMTHSQGTAADLVDETSTNTPSVDAQLKMPDMSAIPALSELPDIINPSVEE